jgi:hypothetical protein
MAKSVVVTSETESGRNQNFFDKKTKKKMTRAEFVKQIESGSYNSYHVRKVNGLKTPVSNPDRSEGNNLD